MRLKQITLNRVEGRSEECNKPVTVTNFIACDVIINRMAKTAPSIGYDKVEFKVEFTDIDTEEEHEYVGRLDLMKKHEHDNDILVKQMLRYLKYQLKELLMVENKNEIEVKQIESIGRWVGELEFYLNFF